MKSRVEETIARHDKGYNCAQAVVCTYCDLLGIDEETAFKMSEGFGFGMGMTEVCGAVSGMTFIAGLKNSDGNLSAPKTKKDTYTLSREMAQKFNEDTFFLPFLLNFAKIIFNSLKKFGK